jgi:hypothetical protein
MRTARVARRKKHKPHPRREAQRLPTGPSARMPSHKRESPTWLHSSTTARVLKSHSGIVQNKRHRPPLIYLLGLKLPSLNTQVSAQGRACRPSRALEGDMSDVCFHLSILLRVLDRVLPCHRHGFPRTNTTHVLLTLSYSSTFQTGG